MKIFVTVGTQEQPFSRLFEMIEKVDFPATYVMQTGTVDYCNNKYKTSAYIEDFAKEISEADIIITHGGVGSILTSLKANKKVIVVPRLAKYGEHVNDHQIEITAEYVNKGLILMAQTVEELNTALNNIDNFKPEKFISNNQNFIEQLEEIIGDLC